MVYPDERRERQDEDEECLPYLPRSFDTGLAHERDPHRRFRRRVHESDPLRISEHYSSLLSVPHSPRPRRPSYRGPEEDASPTGRDQTDGRCERVVRALVCIDEEGHPGRDEDG